MKDSSISLSKYLWLYSCQFTRIAMLRFKVSFIRENIYHAVSLIALPNFQKQIWNFPHGQLVLLLQNNWSQNVLNFVAIYLYIYLFQIVFNIVWIVFTNKKMSISVSLLRCTVSIERYSTPSDYGTIIKSLHIKAISYSRSILTHKRVLQTASL